MNEVQRGRKRAGERYFPDFIYYPVALRGYVFSSETSNRQAWLCAYPPRRLPSPILPCRLAIAVLSTVKPRYKDMLGTEKNKDITRLSLS
jgi:hypothetical protein